MWNLFLNETKFPIKIFYSRNKDNIFRNIFPEEDIKDKDNWEKRILKKSTKFTENETKKTISVTVVSWYCRR